MHDLKLRFLEWVAHYGPLGLFSLLVLGIVGLPVPDEFLLTYAGFLCFKHQMSLPAAMVAGFCGASCGITLSYAIGRLLGTDRVERIAARIGFHPEKLELVRAWFERRGKWTLVIGYYVPGVRHFTAIVAGTSHLRPDVFVPFAYAGALLWSQSFIVLGYTLGNGWERAAEWVHSRLLLVAVVVAVLLVAWFVVRAVRARSRSRAAARDKGAEPARPE